VDSKEAQNLSRQLSKTRLRKEKSKDGTRGPENEFLCMVTSISLSPANFLNQEKS
jgi:hypothetical protein